MEVASSEVLHLDVTGKSRSCGDVACQVRQSGTVLGLPDEKSLKATSGLDTWDALEEQLLLARHGTSNPSHSNSLKSKFEHIETNSKEPHGSKRLFQKNT